MGTGKITLYWYALCFIICLLIFIVGGGLVLFGNWQKRHEEKRASNSQPSDSDKSM